MSFHVSFIPSYVYMIWQVSWSLSRVCCVIDRCLSCMSLWLTGVYHVCVWQVSIICLYDWQVSIVCVCDWQMSIMCIWLTGVYHLYIIMIDRCHGSCLECYGPDLDQCTACFHPLKLAGGVCLEGCPLGKCGYTGISQIYLYIFSYTRYFNHSVAP